MNLVERAMVTLFPFYHILFSAIPEHIILFQLALVSPDDDQFDVLHQKLMERLEEGQGETIYELGVGGEHLLEVSYNCILF